MPGGWNGGGGAARRTFHPIEATYLRGRNIPFAPRIWVFRWMRPSPHDEIRRGPRLTLAASGRWTTDASHIIRDFDEQAIPISV